jgi:hypothetical protein
MIVGMVALTSVEYSTSQGWLVTHLQCAKTENSFSKFDASSADKRDGLDFRGSCGQEPLAFQ